MKIVVCLKQVPDTTAVKIDPKTGTLIRDGVPSIINPEDKHALEAALQLKDNNGAEVTVLSMGPPQAKSALREALCMGADKAILITDRAFAGADTLATSKALAGALKKLEYDIIFAGRQAIDGDTAQVGPEIAEHLNIPQVTYVQGVKVEEDGLLVNRALEDGYELIKSLREAKYDVPILIITAKSEIEDKKEGFLLGADDYMVKPIDIEEMLLRIQVLLRRSKSASEKKIQIGDLLLNYNQLSVIKKDKVYNLAQKEFYLLYKLLSTPNTIFTRQELIEEVWGLESDSDYRTVDVHIKRIREKMKDVDEFEIVTIRGIGYKAIIHEKG